jgi:lipopolysaccharide/colanic/teichoic acid biosynthesis glycosyltransferase
MSTLAFKEETSTSEQSASPMPICRAIDVALAGFGLILATPVLLIACLAIRIESRGPAVFRQRRLGRGKKPFTLHKLRTMRTDADPEIHRRYVQELLHKAQQPRDGKETDGLYKLTGDDRVTRVGRFLRKTSLDELPQLYDVIRGHMSLVGPRPVIAYEVEMYPDGYERRFAVKPGLTGLWQVSGRNERTYHEMLALDIEWVDRRSLALYLSIVVRTPFVLLRRRGVA